MVTGEQGKLCAETHFALVLQSAQPGAGSAQTPDKTPKEKDDKQAPEKAAKPETAAQSALSPAERLTYIIGVEDELQISVWREPELSTI
jgi:protein involved in polysaccharide export with SLBB domain